MKKICVLLITVMAACCICSCAAEPQTTEKETETAEATADAGELGRYAYIQKIDFDENGAPVLGEPLPRSTKITVPSGEQ